MISEAEVGVEVENFLGLQVSRLRLRLRLRISVWDNAF